MHRSTRIAALLVLAAGSFSIFGGAATSKGHALVPKARLSLAAGRRIALAARAGTVESPKD